MIWNATIILRERDVIIRTQTFSENKKTKSISFESFDNSHLFCTQINTDWHLSVSLSLSPFYSMLVNNIWRTQWLIRGWHSLTFATLHRTIHIYIFDAWYVMPLPRHYFANRERFQSRCSRQQTASFARTARLLCCEKSSINPTASRGPSGSRPRNAARPRRDVNNVSATHVVSLWVNACYLNDLYISLQ